MPKPKPSPEPIEGEDISQTTDQLAALEQKAITRLGRLAVESGLGDIQITNAKLRSGFGDMVAALKRDKPRTTPLNRTRTKLARLKRKAAHKTRLARNQDKREKIAKGEWLNDEG